MHPLNATLDDYSKSAGVKRTIQKKRMNCKFYPHCRKGQYCDYLHGPNDRCLRSGVAKFNWYKQESHVPENERLITEELPGFMPDEADGSTTHMAPMEQVAPPPSIQPSQIEHDSDYYCNYYLGKNEKFNDSGKYICDIIDYYSQKQNTKKNHSDMLIYHSTNIQRYFQEYIEINSELLISRLQLEFKTFMFLFELNGGEMYELFKYYQTLK